MSSSSVGDTPVTETPPADLPALAGPTPELAPSETARDEPSFPRTVGMGGAFVAFVGAAGLLAVHFEKTQFLSPPTAATFVLLGMVAMLYHAARDGEQEIRRTYGLFALGLTALSLILWVLNKSIFPFAAPGLLASLAFLSFFLRHESEEGWRRPFLLLLGLLGAAMFLGILYGALLNQTFFVQAGIALALLSLGFLGALMGQFGSSTDEGRMVGFGVLAAGAALLSGAVIGTLATGGADQFLFPKGMLLGCIGFGFIVFALAALSEIPVVVMARKELASYFFSPVAYFLLIGMTVIGLLNFFSFVNRLMPPDDLGRRFMPLSEPLIGYYFISGIAGWIAPLCVVPMLTMRLLSEEKRTGTYEVLMSAPVSELSVVVSKFVAALAVYLLMWLPWGAYLIGLAGELDKPFEYRPILTFGIALFFTGASFIAMGMFFSSLTRNQIVAAVLTFATMLFLLLVILFVDRGSSQVWQQIFLKLSFYRVWEDSIFGKILLHDLILYLSITAFWLFLTVKALEARKWN